MYLLPRKESRATGSSAVSLIPPCHFVAHAGEGVQEVAVGIDLEALKGHRATGRIAEQPFQLVPTMRRHQRIGMQGKAMNAGTARAGQGRALAFVAKA